MFSSLKMLSVKARSGSIMRNACFGKKRALILGIETSCDDTGCAIVDSHGNLLGESLHSQHLVHLNNGGIIPPIAHDLHKQHIEQVVNEAVAASDVSFEDIDAIATTVKPGLPMSLLIGMRYGKYLCKKYGKPFIPIHHMQAHALVPRIFDKSLEFPFLVLLISGGHCLLAVARGVDDFLLLGESLDDAPGEAFDKMARRMKLKNLPEYALLSGGKAIELLATKADEPRHFQLTIPLTKYKDCNFSMSGLKNQVLTVLKKEELKWGTPADGLVPTISNLCHTFLMTVTRHLCHRVQRGMQFCSLRNLIPSHRKSLVVSGGVACNDFITRGLEILCAEQGYTLVRPPPKLCTDNGVMIAWNGMEKWKINCGVLHDYKDVDIESKSPLGISMIDDVSNANISCKWVKLTQLYETDSEDPKAEVKT